MSHIRIGELKQVPLGEQEIEICERKGLRHPDTICDAVMDCISASLSQEYKRRIGRVLHHNIDKGLLVAGETRTRFGGGEIQKPMLMVFGDRATFKVGEEKIPVDFIVKDTAKNWFRDNLRYVDPEEHLKYQVELGHTSEALAEIFQVESGFLEANDTSAAVGYAPMTSTEKIIVETEKFLNSKEFKKAFPCSGEDVKIMALRTRRELHLTIAMAFVDQFIESERTYFQRKEEVLEEVRQFVEQKVDMDSINLYFNTLDTKGKGEKGLYLTVLGTSADGADCGQVGKGNKVNGIIPLCRPTGSEAAAGKNPVSHVGKIYNVLSYQIASRIYEEVPDISEVYVWLLSRIGESINQPTIVSAQFIPKNRIRISEISKDVEEIIEDKLTKIGELCVELARGQIPIY